MPIRASIAILDNFCWGYTDRAETLGSLVRAAIACQDMAVALGTPFISGKDSLNNEFSYFEEDGSKQTISIPPSLLISAMGQIEDVSKAVTMDAKRAGNAVVLVGETKAELGGSHFCLVRELSGGEVPKVDAARAKATFAAVHRAIAEQLIRSCHDLSEGGLAVAATEMAMAGGLGMTLDLDAVQTINDDNLSTETLLFSESNSRFLLEVEEQNLARLQAILDEASVPATRMGTISRSPSFTVSQSDHHVMNMEIETAKQAWQKPLDW